jgi:L-iditol 2-dehydrogenase
MRATECKRVALSFADAWPGEGHREPSHEPKVASFLERQGEDGEALLYPGRGDAHMGQTMKAAVFEGPGQLVVRDVEVPRLDRADAVKIEVEAVGICGTDVHITSVPPGYPATPGTILGHEFVGRVVEIGSAVTHLAPGDRVVVNPNDYCGTCWACQTHLPNLCEHVVAVGINAHGAFARYWVGSAKLAFRVAETVGPDQGVFAEMLADVINGTRKVRLQPGETAVVIGMGPIGHLFGQVFRLAGAAKVIALETSAYRQERARAAGWDLLADPAKDDVRELVLQETGIGGDVVVDAAGSALPLAVELARKGGRVLLFGVNTAARATVPQSLITTKEIQVLGTWLANATFPSAVQLLETGRVRTEELITHRLPLASLSDGLDLLRRGQALKVVIKP